MRSPIISPLLLFLVRGFAGTSEPAARLKVSALGAWCMALLGSGLHVSTCNHVVNNCAEYMLDGCTQDDGGIMPYGYQVPRTQHFGTNGTWRHVGRLGEVCRSNLPTRLNSTLVAVAQGDEKEERHRRKAQDQARWSH